MYNHIIYKLVDPTNKEIHYIGYTSNKKQRYTEHCTKTNGTKEKRIWISRLKIQGLKPIIEVVATYPDPDMLPQAEEIWYNAFKNAGCDLYQDSTCIGSNNRKGAKFTKEQKDHQSQMLKGRVPWNKGLKLGPLPEEQKMKISKSNKGQKRSNETKKKISDKALERGMSGAKNPNYKHGLRINKKENL